jgi:rod shape-determining protein MreD
MPWGISLGVPDFVALCLVFWCLHEPRKVGIGTAFFMGLLMDVHNSIFLGENALAYTLIAFIAISIQKRLLWFGVFVQVMHLSVLFFIILLLKTLVRLSVAHDAHFPSFWYFMEAISTAILWPLATWILLAPQRRSVNKDETRPI